MTSYRLPWQHARSTKRSSKLQLLKIIGKTKSVTHRFYFFVGKLPKFFNLLESMRKSYLVEFKIHQKMAYYSLQFFSAGFISVSRDFMPYFHFRCVARATFDRNLNHSADACFLVMACVAYSRVKLKILSSLLK